MKNKKELNFVHSGHLGDIIYSLATIKKLYSTLGYNFPKVEAKIKDLIMRSRLL